MYIKFIISFPYKLFWVLKVLIATTILEPAFTLPYLSSSIRQLTRVHFPNTGATVTCYLFSNMHFSIPIPCSFLKIYLGPLSFLDGFSLKTLKNTILYKNAHIILILNNHNCLPATLFSLSFKLNVCV